MWFSRHKALMIVILIIAAALCASFFLTPSAPAPEQASPPAEPAPQQEAASPVAPVIEDAPEPAPAQAEAPAAPAQPTCTVSIRCDTILDNLDKLDAEKTDLVPPDGVILPPTEVCFFDGESVFDVLLRICTERKIHLEFSDTPMYHSVYIEGIANLYEFDCGELSGWMYSVNGWFPNYGCSRYVLKDGDQIAWQFTCDLGADVGGGEVVQNEG